MYLFKAFVKLYLWICKCKTLKILWEPWYLHQHTKMENKPGQLDHSSQSTLNACLRDVSVHTSEILELSLLYHLRFRNVKARLCSGLGGTIATVWSKQETCHVTPPGQNLNPNCPQRLTVRLSKCLH